MRGYIPNSPQVEISLSFLGILESTFNPILSAHSPNTFNSFSVKTGAPRNAFK